MTGGGQASVDNAATVSLPALYPSPPIHYSDVDVLVLVPPAPLNIALPGGLAPAGGISILMLSDYPTSDLGPYRELFVLTAAMHGTDLVWFCPLIYVTSDAALAAGREIWGFPKKLADISFELGEGTVKASVRRNQAALEITGQLTVDLDVGSLVTPDDAIVNLRAIPSPDGATADAHLVGVNFEFDAKRARGGTADLASTSGPEDPLAELFGSHDGCAISVFHADVVLPYGRFLGA